MGAYGNLIFNDKELSYSSVEENSGLAELIDKLAILSKAGNLLASQLYDKIYDRLEGIVNEISIKLTELDSLLMYYDLYQVFNSTLVNYSYKKLTSDIVQISNELVSRLSGIFNNIKSGEIRSNAETLEDNIYSYINELHEIIRKMLENIGRLSNILATKNNTFTVITNYYLNNTSSSYVNIIQKMKTILDTYFIYEYNTIYPKIEEILILLEQNSNDTLKNELLTLKDLFTNLKEGIYTINSITESDFQTVLSNLENSLQYPFDIIKRIKEYIKELMNIKSNGYFISAEDINSFNNSFTSLILEAEEVAKKLDNIDIIDKVFDRIMIKFREGYIYTIKFMEEIKSGNFTLEEDVLNTTLFSQSEKNKMENELKSLCDNILNIIKKENEVYMEKIKRYFDKFLDDNLDNLNDIIIDISIIFSEEAIQTMA